MSIEYKRSFLHVSTHRIWRQEILANYLMLNGSLPQTEYFDFTTDPSANFRVLVTFIIEV